MWQTPHSFRRPPDHHMHPNPRGHWHNNRGHNNPAHINPTHNNPTLWPMHTGRIVRTPHDPRRQPDHHVHPNEVYPAHNNAAPLPMDPWITGTPHAPPLWLPDHFHPIQGYHFYNNAAPLRMDPRWVRGDPHAPRILPDHHFHPYQVYLLWNNTAPLPTDLWWAHHNPQAAGRLAEDHSHPYQMYPVYNNGAPLPTDIWWVRGDPRAPPHRLADHRFHPGEMYPWYRNIGPPPTDPWWVRGDRHPRIIDGYTPLLQQHIPDPDVTAKLEAYSIEEAWRDVPDSEKDWDGRWSPKTKPVDLGGKGKAVLGTKSAHEQQPVQPTSALQRTAGNQRSWSWSDSHENHQSMPLPSVPSSKLKMTVQEAMEVLEACGEEILRINKQTPLPSSRKPELILMREAKEVLEAYMEKTSKSDRRTRSKLKVMVWQAMQVLAFQEGHSEGDEQTRSKVRLWLRWTPAVLEALFGKGTPESDEESPGSSPRKAMADNIMRRRQQTREGNEQSRLPSPRKAMADYISRQRQKTGEATSAAGAGGGSVRPVGAGLGVDIDMWLREAHEVNMEEQRQTVVYRMNKYKKRKGSRRRSRSDRGLKEGAHFFGSI